MKSIIKNVIILISNVAEIRTEAVQQALAASNAKQEKATALQPIRRPSSKRPNRGKGAGVSVDTGSSGFYFSFQMLFLYSEIKKMLKKCAVQFISS